MIREFGYVRIGTAVPEVRAADVTGNVERLVTSAKQASEAGCDLVVFPELCITGYTCADLFLNTHLLNTSEQGLADFLDRTADLPPVFVVGLPMRFQGELFNVAAVVQRGEILGVVPKVFLPGNGEYYEPRWFSSGHDIDFHIVGLAERGTQFSNRLLFECEEMEFVFAVEICEDLWAPIPPSSYRALEGATVLVNPSASNELVGKADYRRHLVQQQSARCFAAYAYCSAGVGESTTDMVMGGHCLIAENGITLAESDRFQRSAQLTFADVDVAFLEHERLGRKTFSQNRKLTKPSSEEYFSTVATFHVAEIFPQPLSRSVPATPFVPGDPARRHDRCQEILAIQSTGLATRLHHTGIKDVVIGLSGGLDSTLALLVCIEAFKSLGLDRSGIHAYTMPGFGTTARTKGNADALCETLGIPLDTVDIGPACKQHFADIGHDGKTHDIAYENVQARERTQILMDASNMHRALVVGTGDLSELALGWCTYNGDHMSMYAVNTGVPKTLVSYLIAYYADDKADAAVEPILRDILDTPISPELLPPDENGEIAQKTEHVVGPYLLHDFFLYHVVRCGFPPQKVLFLAQQAFAETHDEDTLRKWLREFLRRFFGQQFKRSCLPDGPKVGTIALSPRGDWRMPSDAQVRDWLDRL
jgi:NAD+ synthase (glutamine-hydrolysing)